MSIDLNFWKYRSGVYLDNAMVYQKACCDNEQVEGLEHLPIDAILKETAAVFHEWTSPDPFNYEREGLGSFQISTTSQTVRFDCYSMGPADMKRFSSILSKFGCPLYDPQQGVRFDKQMCIRDRPRAGRVPEARVEEYGSGFIETSAGQAGQTSF